MGQSLARYLVLIELERSTAAAAEALANGTSPILPAGELTIL